MAEMDFMFFPVASIRRSIKDIDDSYRNPWDIYAELTQNAVDAIRKMQSVSDEKGIIELTINAKDKKIEIYDNGCGISSDELPVLLQLFSSGKSTDSSTVGEKGVGLKFAYFQSKYFEIISSNGTTGGKAIIKDARLWKNGTGEDLLKLDFEKTSNEPRGTRIILEGIQLDNDDSEQATSIFNLSFDQIKYVLRNKTYLGDTHYIWDSDQSPITVNLTYTDFNGSQYKEVIKNEYILPTELLSTNDIVDIDEFEKWIKEKDRSDTDKRNKLQGKVLVLKGEYQHKGFRKISYWACFMPTRRDWDNINVKNKLIPENDEATEEWLQNNSYCLIAPGIFTSTKGMPTGISVDTPNTGYAGYWQNFFMLFQDDSLAFDIGRKSIHGKIQSIYQAKAKEIFTKITKYVAKYTSATPATSTTSSTFDRYEIRNSIDKLVDLNTTKVSFIKMPSEQEASVSAIFFELIGNGTIKDIVPIYLGYRNKYDLYANYISSQDERPHFCFIEFKSHLKHITKDFSEARKVFDEMDYIICWDVNDTDIQALSDFGINCEAISNGSLHSIDCPAAVTHSLTIPNCNPVYVIDLKKLM